MFKEVVDRRKIDHSLPPYEEERLWRTWLGQLFFYYSHYIEDEEAPSFQNVVRCYQYPSSLALERTGVIENLRISPCQLIDYLLIDQNLVRHGATCSLIDGEPSSLQKTALKKLKAAERLMLCGCISIGSAEGLLSQLSNLEAFPNIDIYEINPVSVELLRLFRKQWKQQYKIDVNVIEADLTKLESKRQIEEPLQRKSAKLGTITQIPYKYYDTVLIDVLGPYLKNIELRRDLPVVANVVASDGLIFVSDLEQRDMVSNSHTSTAEKDEVELEEKNIAFAEWLEKEFDISLPLNSVAYLRKHIFGSKNSVEPKARGGQEII